ncbi:MAG TPA: PCRF domain-containing protein, partial [Spirochaetia bacterium]|nr:PCRF domain-containing protein [Spirochaetia bacterium]
MIDKLERSKKRYEELQALISDPEVIRDMNRYRELRQELASLSDLVDEFGRYNAIEAEIASNRDLAASAEDNELIEMAREELAALESRKAASMEKLKVLLVPKDPLDDKNVIMEIRAGTGGDEAALFAADLFRMYSYYVDSLKWKIEILSSSPTGIGGFKEIISSITGKGVYARLRYESGVHRVQRVPVTEAGGRIHTSTASVAVLPEVEETEIEINQNELRID